MYNILSRIQENKSISISSFEGLYLGVSQYEHNLLRLIYTDRRLIAAARNNYN